MRKAPCPEVIFSRSSRSFTRRTRRSQFCMAIDTRPWPSSVSSPATPPCSRPSEPRIEVSGVVQGGVAGELTEEGQGLEARDVEAHRDAGGDAPVHVLQRHVDHVHVE